MIRIKDFLSEYKSMEEEIDAAIKRVLLSGNYILGPEVKAFEEEFAKSKGNKYCVGVASGTDAITISLMAFGIGKGNEVITSNFTAYPTIVGIERSGAKAIVVDVKENAFIDSKQIEKKITKRTKAIVPVYLFEKEYDDREILKIARKYKIKVIQDFAQNSFAKVTGDCGAFSFYPTKTLGCYGDGGAVVTDSKKTYEKLLMLRNYGQKVKNKFNIKGMNSRLDEIQAAILRVKLRHKDELLANEQVIEDYNRTARMKEFEKQGIETIIHYPYTISKQKAFKGQKKEKFPNSEVISRKIFSIPRKPLTKNTL